MHLTDTNYKKYYPLEGLCYEGLISKITIVDFTELEPLIEDIQWLFDETISIEALVGDYIAAYTELGENISSAFEDQVMEQITNFLLQDYEDGGLFTAVAAKGMPSVSKTLRQIFQLIHFILKNNEIELDDEPPWELVGMRGQSHVIFGQEKTTLSAAHSAALQTQLQDSVDGN